jgi:hypothetical protein
MTHTSASPEVWREIRKQRRSVHTHATSAADALLTRRSVVVDARDLAGIEVNGVRRGVCGVCAADRGVS